MPLYALAHTPNYLLFVLEQLRTRFVMDEALCCGCGSVDQSATERNGRSQQTASATRKHASHTTHAQ